MVQNQLGNKPKRWDRRGVVVQADTKARQYKIMLFGSRRHPQEQKVPEKVHTSLHNPWNTHWHAIWSATRSTGTQP